MTSSPPLSIELRRGCLRHGLWALQLLAVGSLYGVLPLQVALPASLMGLLLLIRAWPRNTPCVLVLRDDRTVRVDDGAWSALTQAQDFLGTLVLTLATGHTVWIWPDMLSSQASCDLRRWLKLHPPQPSDPRSKALMP